MFGALNRFIARLDAEPRPQSANSGPGDNAFGFQVLRNTNKELPLEPWFDFIIGLNGHYVESPDHNLFIKELQNCAGGYCSLDIWSAKGQKSHALTVAVPPAPESLGISLQLAGLNSTQNVWHILAIPSPLSPAYLAGLLPYSDYILGSPAGILNGEAAFGELVEDHLNRSLVLWVYNSEFDVVREVELIPRRGWGGEGALGAVLGFGALHRLPIGLGEEVQAPGEKLFEAERTSTEYVQNGQSHFVPAEPSPALSPPPMMNPHIPPPPMLSPNAPIPRTSTATRSKKGRQHALPPGAGFDDMFAEGAKKSAEQDAVPSRKGTPLAPPPKLGEGPPSATASATQEISDPLDSAGEELGEPGEAEVT